MSRGDKRRAILDLAVKAGLNADDLASWFLLFGEDQSSFLSTVTRKLSPNEALALFEDYMDLDCGFAAGQALRRRAVFRAGNTWVLHQEDSEADEPFEIIELREGLFRYARMYLLTTHPLAFASLSGAILLVNNDGAVVVLNEGDDGWSGAQIEARL